MYKYEMVEERKEWAVIERMTKNNSIVQVFRFDKFENTEDDVIAYMNQHYNAGLDRSQVLYDIHAGAEENMPCDTYGPCACSTACPQYYQCQA